MDLKALKSQILQLTQQYAQQAHAAQKPAKTATETFIAGETVIPYAGRVFESEEVVAAVESALDFWLTLGVHGKAFEVGLAKFLGVQQSVLTNSGSSANLLAVCTLTSPKLPPERRLMLGDEVITCA
ncbi:MAG TPA: DegT/DnrJ/EryC1/StrS family aminotransferase, partial [Opitutales bacterium]|nr:DegT/DnrJ/EryC1/StrS family aminotransferase [Opitutales bacterium]